ncbi:hypothetical protein [Kibdelosporangium aridum]|uniref:hypothetical protein n=1 Tax=Kibdelosporangium aridum TaxID=2030 RepID=UPI000F791FAE|nr:hypothetical protein [Kibdelosporangium aridum]
MTYGPPPNQHWQQPPPPGPYGPQKPPLPGNLVTLGILGILLGLACVLGANVLSLIPALVAIAGGIMVFARQRAGAILLAISSGLVLLLTLLGVVRELANIRLNLGYRINLELEDDWMDLLRLLLAIAVLVFSLLPQTTQALTGGPMPRPGPPGPPPPGYAPQPPGYPPPPPNWRQ